MGSEMCIRDSGSIVTAAQSGAEWGYRLLALQFVLVPILYVVQELTVRLGIVERQGHAALIREKFGRGWAFVSVAALIAACVGALLSELSGLAGVGAMLGVPAWTTMVLVVGFLVAIAMTGTYLTVERVAIAVGAFELVFLLVAWRAQPALADLATQALDLPARDPKYLYLVAANIGAVIMPWMVFYQQSAVVEKKLGVGDLKAARVDTAIGACVTQLIMASVLVATAAVLSGGNAGASLDTVQQIAEALTPALGSTFGMLLFGLGMTGAAMVATIVVTLTAARTLGETLGYEHSLEHSPREAPWFYVVYTLALVAGAAIVLSGVNLVTLSVGVQVMNALLLPIVLGFLYLLARRLPEPHRLQGVYAGVVATIVVVTVVFALYSGIAGIWG